MKRESQEDTYPDPYTRRHGFRIIVLINFPKEDSSPRKSSGESNVPI